MFRFPPAGARVRFVLGAVLGVLMLEDAAGQRARPADTTLRAVTALPAHLAGQFEQLTACRQTAAGDYYVFDRRAHTVYTIAAGSDRIQKLIEIGTEPGRVLDPTSFDLAPDGTFVVTDAPHGRPRVQIFTMTGSTLGSFFLPGPAVPRVTFRSLVLSGIGNVEYVGTSLFVNQPELDSLVVEYSANGGTVRTFGSLRRTGHETERPVHLALNSGVIVANPPGGFYFVFLAGVPAFRKYDAAGALVFERHIEGRELDELIQELPTTWQRRKTEAGEIPLVLPSVLAAAADAAGNLWISLPVGVTYVYDAAGEKRRTVRFHGAGPLSPTGLSFTAKDRLLATPGCYAFDTR